MNWKGRGSSIKRHYTMKKCIENYKPSCVHKYIDWTEDAIYGGQCKKEWSLKWLTHLLPERRVHEYVEVQIKF